MIPEALRDFRAVRNVEKKIGKKPAFKRPPTIFNLLRNVKDPVNHDEKTGVYNIPLRNLDEGTDELYIGATRRNLKERLAVSTRETLKMPI